MKTQTYKVVEIFKSIEGEGSRAGVLATFIRLYGCNLRCTYCDTLYGIEGGNYTEMTLQDIMFELKRHKSQFVTLTGGEPLIHENVHELIDAITARGYFLNIETNGAVDVTPYLSNSKVLLTLDYKCPSSGMESKMLMTNFEYVRPKDVVKFVVGTTEDLDMAKEVIQHYGLHNTYLSPVFGKIEPKDIVQYMIDNHLYDTKIQLQLHKYIWDPEMKGV